MSLNIMSHNRAIYSVLDFLGDVGGLFDMLKLIGEVLISLMTMIFGSSLNKHMLEKLYRLDKQSKRQN